MSLAGVGHGDARMIRRDYSRAARMEARVARTRRRGDDGDVKTSLDHLPEGKRRELAFVVDVLRSGFTAARSPRRSDEEAILRIVLFGSYARGDWVEDPIGRYFSDYDLLVQAWTVAQLRSRRIRHARMGRLVQPSSAARTHR